MGIAELFNTLFTSEKMVHPPQNNSLLLEYQLLRSRETELENRIKQAAEHRALTESTLAINDSQIVALQNQLKMDHPQKSFELESPVLRHRVAELEKKLVQLTKEQADSESVLAIKPFELALAEITLKELQELGLCKEDLNRRYEQIQMEETGIAESRKYYEGRLEEERNKKTFCKEHFYKRIDFESES